MEFSGQSITAERGLSVGDILTTDEHGWAQKHGDIMNDNIDNLRPNQYPLGAKRGIYQPRMGTDRHGNTEIYPWFSVGQCSSVVNP